MNDPAGVPSPFGIETVEWLSEGGENLTVRVTGRWRRRRPAWSAQPTLVVEAPGRRHRFPAMPEPPSLSGTPPGKWRISFAVPAALAPELGGRAWLQFGAVAVPLPAAVEPLGAAQIGVTTAEAQRETPEPIARPFAAESETRPAENEAHAAGDGPGDPPRSHEVEHEPGEAPRSGEPEREPAARGLEQGGEAMSALSARVETLESELAQARTEAEELSASLASQQVSRRAAEQRAHSERAQRLDLARQLTDRNQEASQARQALGDLATAEERVRELELELADTRRRIDEAEQVAAAATSARERAERVAAETAGELAQRGASANATELALEHERLGLEHALVARRTGGVSRVPSEPDVKAQAVVLTGARPAREPGGQGRAERVKTADRELVTALQAELELRVRTEASLRARLVESETRIAARQLLERQTAATLGQLRDEFEGLRGALARERQGREAAERHADALGRDLARLHVESGEAHEAVAELRGLIEQLRAVVSGPATEVETRPATAADEPAQTADEPAQTADEPAQTADEPAQTADQTPAQDAPEGAQSAGNPAAKPEPADRLSEALVRLRDAIAPLDAVVSAPAAGSTGVPAAAGSLDVPAAGSPDAPPAATVPETVGRAWLRPVFTAIAATSPERAGRLLVDLIPAQGAVGPTPVAYDLVLGKDLECLRVTVEESRTHVEAGEPRSQSEVDFRIAGDHAALAKLIRAGRVRRRLGWGVARVRGKRGGLAALDHLLDTRLSFGGLYQAGVRMAPRTALTVVAQLIVPAWTSGAKFVLAYEAPPEKALYLVVADGAPVEVKDTGPQGPVATTISGPAGSLELVLAGMADEHRLVIGEDEPLTFLREWVNRAQSA
jgi:hypothetical protein